MRRYASGQKFRCTLALAWRCLLALAPGLGRAESIALLPSADTTLFETFPNNNLGKVLSLAAGTTASGLKSRAVFQFDIAGNIPSNATITSATLILTVVRTPPGGGANSNFDLHRLLRPWGEGAVVGDIFSTGEEARPGEATWNSRFHPSTPWSAPGAEAPADFAGAISATTFVAGLGRHEFMNLAADVQFWLTNSAANFGWILISQEEAVSSTARRFGSREDCFNPPILLVEGSFPPVPPRIHCAELAGSNFRFNFAAAPGHAYVVEYRDDFGGGDWNVLTNLPIQTATRSIVISNALTSGSRFFRVGAQ